VESGDSVAAVHAAAYSILRNNSNLLIGTQIALYIALYTRRQRLRGSPWRCTDTLSGLTVRGAVVVYNFAAERAVCINKAGNNR